LQVDEVIVRFKLVALTVLFLLISRQSTLPLLGQDGPRGPNAPLAPNAGFPSDTHEDEQRAKIEKDMAKKANKQRQVQLQRDTDNLLKLANELKQDVEKSNENTLSLDVVKKAEEIEKLAHSVKEKMKAN
jgi:hypothetical protein